MQEITTSQHTDIAIGFNPNLYSRWIDYIDVKPKSVGTYETAIRQFIQYMNINEVRQPTRADIIAFREYLEQSHKPTTTQLYLTAVKQFFKWTAQEGIYPNIAENVKGAKISHEHKKDYLTADQCRNVLQTIDRDTIKGKRDYAIITLMLTAGLRTIEVIRADVNDLSTLGNETVLYIQGKGRDEKADYVKVPAPVERAIRDYLATRTDGSKELFTSTSNNNKGRLTTRSVSGIVKGYMKQAGYNSDRLTAHSLRHTAGTLNLLNGGTLEETQQLLRHTNINTTMIYLHNLERANNQSEQRIAAAILS